MNDYGMTLPEKRKELRITYRIYAVGSLGLGFAGILLNCPMLKLNYELLYIAIITGIVGLAFSLMAIRIAKGLENFPEIAYTGRNLSIAALAISLGRIVVWLVQGISFWRIFWN